MAAAAKSESRGGLRYRLRSEQHRTAAGVPRIAAEPIGERCLCSTECRSSEKEPERLRSRFSLLRLSFGTRKTPMLSFVQRSLGWTVGFQSLRIWGNRA